MRTVPFLRTHLPGVDRGLEDQQEGQAHRSLIGSERHSNDADSVQGTPAQNIMGTFLFFRQLIKIRDVP